MLARRGMVYGCAHLSSNVYEGVVMMLFSF
jgi:hypothetical protein